MIIKKGERKRKRTSVIVELPGNLRRQLARLAWLLDKELEALLQRIVDDTGPEHDETLEAERLHQLAKLDQELEEGAKQFSAIAAQLSRVQQRYAGIKLKLFHEFQKNRPLVVNLAGAMAENRRLRQALNLSDPHPGLDRELDRFLRVYLQRDLRRILSKGNDDGERGQ